VKKRNLIALGAAAVLLAACIPSVNPFYTEKDVTFDQRLLGEWQEKDATNNPEIWKFEKSSSATNAFKLTVVENGKTGQFTAHLFKIKQEQFLDLTPDKCDYATNQADLVAFCIFPGHLLVHVPQIEPELKLSFFNFDWLEDYLKDNPKALAHHTEDKSMVLTADTRDLQKFVLKHLGTNELFKETGVMIRRPN
jgi:hypothetical protein